MFIVSFTMIDLSICAKHKLTHQNKSFFLSNKPKSKQKIFDEQFYQRWLTLRWENESYWHQFDWIIKKNFQININYFPTDFRAIRKTFTIHSANIFLFQSLFPSHHCYLFSMFSFSIICIHFGIIFIFLFSYDAQNKNVMNEIVL